MPPPKAAVTEQGSKIQVIARAAQILRTLEDAPQGMSLSEIATLVALPRSTVQRIVKALADEQFLISATPTSRVKLGPALVRLARATNLDISNLVRPFLEKMGQELEETIDLSVIEGTGAVFLDQLPGTHRLRAVSAIGERFPLHCTACGKSLLATLPIEKLNALLAGPLDGFTENTVTSGRTLKKEVNKIRSTGIAIDMEEHTEGISGVSVSFYDPIGRAYAISIPAPTARFRRHRKKFTEALVTTRNKIVRELDFEARN